MLSRRMWDSAVFMFELILQYSVQSVETVFVFYLAAPPCFAHLVVRTSVCELLVWVIK